MIFLIKDNPETYRRIEQFADENHINITIGSGIVFVDAPEELVPEISNFFKEFTAKLTLGI